MSLDGFIFYLIVIIFMFIAINLFPLWANRKGVPLRWYELLSITVGTILSIFVIQYTINYDLMILLLLLIPAAALIGFGFCRVIVRYRKDPKP